MIYTTHISQRGLPTISVDRRVDPRAAEYLRESCFLYGTERDKVLPFISESTEDRISVELMNGCEEDWANYCSILSKGLDSWGEVMVPLENPGWDAPSKWIQEVARIATENGYVLQEELPHHKDEAGMLRLLDSINTEFKESGVVLHYRLGLMTTGT